MIVTVKRTKWFLYNPFFSWVSGTPMQTNALDLGIGLELPSASHRKWVYIGIQIQAGEIIASLIISAACGGVSGGAASPGIDGLVLCWDGP